MSVVFPVSAGESASLEVAAVEKIGGQP